MGISQRGARAPLGMGFGPERSGWGFKGEWGWEVIPKGAVNCGFIPVLPFVESREGRDKRMQKDQR